MDNDNRITIEFCDWNEKTETFNVSTQDVFVGQNVRLNPNPFKKEGYLFVGWAKQFGSKYKAYDNGGMFEPIPRMLTDYNRVVRLYTMWTLENNETEPITACIVGYDPLPVVFRDMSDVRSFPTGYWRWDFGDSAVYGCDQTVLTSTELVENSRFRLPGDKKFFEYSDPEFKDVVNSVFHEHTKSCFMNLDFSGNETFPAWSSYYYEKMSASNKDRHFTGLYISTVSGDTVGRGKMTNDRDDEGKITRIEYIPNNDTKIPINVKNRVKNAIPPDQCARTLCENEPVDFKNSVLHVYKGAGVYYASMNCSSDKSLQGMDVDDSKFSPGDSSLKERQEGCYVNVLPVCPCITGFEVFGISGENDQTPPSARKFITVTAEDFSCENDDPFSSTTGAVDYNCWIAYEDLDGNKKKTKAVSGYAPFMGVAASGIIVPRSLPCNGAYIDWGDWFTDYMSGDFKDFGTVISGWPTWETEENRIHFAKHVYTMPGVYSIGLAPNLDIEHIKKYCPTVDLDYVDSCVDNGMLNSISGNCVLVVEIPPKFGDPAITYDDTEISFPTIVKDIKVNVSGGSYPISRLDFDFDFEKNPGKDVISISTEGYYQLSKDVKNNKNDEARKVIYETSTTTAFVEDGTYDNFHDGYLIGNDRYSYRRLPATTWSINHTYTRTEVEDHKNGYVISCSAYAENTNTCSVATVRVLENGAGLPEYEKIEGSVEMVDVRSDQTNDTNIVLQNKNDNQLYFDRVVEKDETKESDKEESEIKEFEW